MNVDEIKQTFKNVLNKLSKHSWFKNDKWIFSIHAFPNEKSPEGITLQIFKKNWWNDDRQGIHIEAYLDLDPKKQKKTYVTLHLLHSNFVPGTQIKRIKFSEMFIDQVFFIVQKWPGYKFRAGKYGTQPFTKFLDGTMKSFESELETELARICKLLGPVLDACIAEFSKKTLTK